MSYLYLDDRFAQHPKLASLTDRAFRAHVLALCYCSAQLTDGVIPLGALKTLGTTKASVTELVGAGLWIQNEKEVRIHDYLDWQDSRDEVLARRESASKAGKARVRGAKRDATGRLVGAAANGATGDASGSLEKTLAGAGPASPAEDPASPAPSPTPREVSSREEGGSSLEARLDAVFAKLGCDDDLLKHRLSKDPALAVVVEKLEHLAKTPGHPGANPSTRVTRYLAACEDTLASERQRVQQLKFSRLPRSEQAEIVRAKLKSGVRWPDLTSDEWVSLDSVEQTAVITAQMAVPEGV